ncbi:MAG: YIP1 family protein [Candidatus Krumholzibacteriota bacterium]|nr:YIP1 family protein [Candidatus Krumholzibacteriota bacterium]
MNAELDKNQVELVDSSGKQVSGGFLASLLDIIIDPVKVFKRIDAGMHWWKAYVFVTVVTILVSWLNMPIQRQLVLINEKGWSEERVSAALEQMDKFGWVGFLMIPIGIIVVYMIVGGLVNLMVNLISGRSSFRKSLGIIAFTGVIGLIEQVLTVVVVRMKDLEAAESAAELKIHLGPAALFSDTGGITAAFLESLSIFQIWYYVVFVIGVAAVFKVERKKAIIPAALLWILSVVFIYIGKLFGG